MGRLDAVLRLSCTFFTLAGKRGRVHLRVHHPVLHPAAADVRRLRRGQADEQPAEEDEADPGGAQQQQRPRQEAGTDGRYSELSQDFQGNGILFHIIQCKLDMVLSKFCPLKIDHVSDGPYAQTFLFCITPRLEPQEYRRRFRRFDHKTI